MSCPTCDHTMAALTSEHRHCPNCGTVTTAGHAPVVPALVKLADDLAWSAIHEIDDDDCREVKTAGRILNCTQKPDGRPLDLVAFAAADGPDGLNEDW
jgi:hypothetical protein